MSPLPSGPLYQLGDWVQLVGIVPGLIFVIDYGLLSLRRVAPEYRWYRNGVGIMFFAIGLAFVATGLVVALSLSLGPFYPGREWVRLIGYTVASGAMIWMLIVYAIERRSPASVLVPQDRRLSEAEERAAYQEFERSRPKRPEPISTHPVRRHRRR